MIKNWERIVVQPTVTIKEAWRALDSAGLRVVLVADADGTFVGIATDGDIRRGLLGSATLDDSISSVLNSRPLIVEPGLKKERLISIMESNRFLALPVVDKGRLIGVEVLQDLLSPPQLDNPVFIMAGGFGTRLRPLTDNCPKPMLPVAGVPMLELLVKRFKSLGFYRFYISTHYLPHIIKDYFGDGKRHNVSIEYVHENAPLGTGGALGLLPDNAPELPLVMINGDILCDFDFSALLEAHLRSGAAATMCVKSYEVNIPYGVVEGVGRDISAMVEKPTYEYSVNTGIYVVSPGIYRKVKQEERIDMPTLLQREMSNGSRVYKQKLHGYWLDIGRMEDYNRAQTDAVTLSL